MIYNREFLRKNLNALAGVNEELYARLSAVSHDDWYSFSVSRSGETVPVLKGQSLHSLIDPKREAQRLVSTINQRTNFLIFLGFGGGFLPEAALEQTDAYVIVIDFNLNGIAEIFSSRDYSELIKNDRFYLLAHPSCDEIKTFILEQYKPPLSGGIQIIPLRARAEIDKPLFDGAIAAVQEAIEIVSGDFTVQAHFGKRWFSNIIRNIKQSSTNSEQPEIYKKQIHEAAIIAAGPSLDSQLYSIAELKARNVFIISTDTALPVLAHNRITPDAVVSIDCQHISYYHFLNCSLNVSIPLFLDIASPPLLSHFSGFTPVFFSSGHPLARYFSGDSLPSLDTSGGNVTYACLSAAEYLGAERIYLFGADFAYINSRSYARGTYIYPHFYKRQNRLSPIEAQFSKFLYRSPFLPSENGQLKTRNEKYFETASLRFYRKKLEEKASLMNAEIICAVGSGAPVSICKKQKTERGERLTIDRERGGMSDGVKFLEKYKDDIAKLPDTENKRNYFTGLNLKNKSIFTTLLPFMAAVKKMKPELTLKELIKEVKRCCISEIEYVLE